MAFKKHFDGHFNHSLTNVVYKYLNTFGFILGCKLHIKKCHFGADEISEVCFVLAEVCVAFYRTSKFISADAHIVIVMVMFTVKVVDVVALYSNT